jgi:hypothetical protein
VQREEVDVSVTLRNNFDFDLEVVSFSLWYSTFFHISHSVGPREQ